MNRAAAAVHPPTLQLRFDHGVPVLVIDEAANVEALRAALRNHMPDHVATIGGRATRLELGAREITLFDLRRIIHLLKQEYSVEITGLYVRAGAIHRFAERELKLKLFANDPPIERAVPHPSGEDDDTEELDESMAEIGPAVLSAAVIAEPTSELEKLSRVTLPHDIDPCDLVEPPRPMAPFAASDRAFESSMGQPSAPAVPAPSTYVPAPHVPAPHVPAPHMPGSAGDTGSPVAAPESEHENERRTTTLHRTLRSGAVVRFDGDLYVFGDVNPGAQVIATGNIIVLGALKGVAHAGAAGDESTFIMAFDLRPTQIRIGRKIAVPPPRRSSTPPPPELATVCDGQIVIEAYRGKIRI